MPLNQQEQENIVSPDEQKISNETQTERPLTPPTNRQRFDPNVWVNLTKRYIYLF